ncbi:hypothetical protein Anae109_4115 [Anaeromyxobacter sp. Fw109-5]|nr:hypothetical protein Anae109_4115 [Anaeromyxobacter sp. Fw109-5]
MRGPGRGARHAVGPPRAPAVGRTHRGEATRRREARCHPPRSTRRRPRCVACLDRENAGGAGHHPLGVVEAPEEAVRSAGDMGRFGATSGAARGWCDRTRALARPDLVARPTARPRRGAGGPSGGGLPPRAAWTCPSSRVP